MLNAFWWVLTVEAIGLVAFPLAYFLFPRLADRGYTVSKPLGILLIGYASWILSILHVMPSVRLSLVSLLLLMGTLSTWYVWTHRREFRDFVLRERSTIIAAEAIFLVFLIGWVIYRAYDPAIDHTEQPMDFAFLNASIESRVGAPEDPWLRGEPVSYYYFGYWMMGAVSQIAGVASNISYNLSMALIPALGATGIFGLVYNMVRSRPDRSGREPARWRYAVVSGVAAALLMGIVANLQGVLEYMRANGMGSQEFWNRIAIKLHATDPSSELMTGLGSANLSNSWRPEEFWWWFRSTRVIDTFDGSQWTDTTIQEFPFFSFMLGDLHPHVMSIPFVILFLAFSLNFLRSPGHTWRRIGIHGYAPIAAMGLSLGGLAFTNLWDLPIFAALFLGIAALKTYSAHGGDTWTLVKGVVPIGAAVIGLAFLLFLPYYADFRPGVTGIEPVTQATTRPIHMFIVWGLYMVAVTPFIIGSFWQTTVREDWRRLTVLGLLAAFLPYLIWAFLHLQDGGTTSDLPGRFSHVLPFALLIGMAVYSALWLVKEGETSGKAFALTLAVLGLLLIMGPELLFVGDFFGNRMNTVFKLYYQAWILLAAVSGFAVYYWRSVRESLRGWTRSLATLWAVAFVVLLVGSLYYPPAAAASKGGPYAGEATLDGLAFLARNNRADYEAIRYVKENVGRDSAILEAVGEWFDAGLISRSTGVPTVFNWPGHELQWRGASEKLDGREQDVATIYETQSVEEATNLLAKYDVDYVYVGPRERAKYGTQGLGKFPSFMEAVFSQDDVVIYRMRR